MTSQVDIGNPDPRLPPRQRAVQWPAIVLSLGLPIAVFGLLLALPRIDLEFGSHTFHFFIGTAIAVVALSLAVAVTAAARHLPNPRTLFLALAFLSMAGIFMAHALGTAPFLNTVPMDGMGAMGGMQGMPGAASVTPLKFVGLSAELSLVVSAIFFALSTLNIGGPLAGVIVRRWNLWALLGAALILAFVVIAVSFPIALNWIPVTSEPLIWSVALVACVAYAFAGWRFFQAYRLSGLAMQGTMALGMLFLIEAVAFLVIGRPWHLSWWEYHFAMLAGFLLPVFGLLTQYRSTGDLGVIVEGLFLRQMIGAVRSGDPEALSALRVAVEAKDWATSRHVERVATLATAVGEKIELPAHELQVLRWAALLHDLGKIGVPNSVLLKTSQLSEEEWEIMQGHSVRGWRAARQSGLLAEAAPAIRAHHERWNGSGYPDGLAGENIPLAARIIAVADVWDAVTSERPYRSPMPREQAVALLQRQRGVLLDPSLVDVFTRVLAEQDNLNGC